MQNMSARTSRCREASPSQHDNRDRKHARSTPTADDCFAHRSVAALTIELAT
jgi:hypothetical protein